MFSLIWLLPDSLLEVIATSDQLKSTAALPSQGFIHFNRELLHFFLFFLVWRWIDEVIGLASHSTSQLRNNRIPPIDSVCSQC